MEKCMSFYMTAGIGADMDNDPTFACEIGAIIHRFVCNDWGDLCWEDQQANLQAQKDGGRVLAVYETSKGRVYVITDDTQANPMVTTILYTDEY